MKRLVELTRGYRGFLLGLAVAGSLAAGVSTVNGAWAQPAQTPINTAFKATTVEGNHLYFVFSNAAAGKDAEYNAFYARHLGDIMKLPGFVSAQRFVMHSRPGRPDPKFHYLAVYEIKGGDPDAVIAELGPAVKEGRLQAPDKAIMPESESTVWTAVGQRGPHS